MKTWVLVLATLLANCPSSHGSVDVSKPQMGWNSYNAFHNEVSAEIMRRTADAFISHGLKDVGYSYVVMDDGWNNYERDPKTKVQAWNQTKFPYGIKPVSDYVHKLGLKIGIYSGVGIYGCSFRPGSWGYEDLDAKTFAEWDIDYLKYDNCGLFEAGTVDPRERFSVMRDALLRSGREIFYSLCEWGSQFPWFWADQVGHSYRMSGDIWKQFSKDGASTCKTAYCFNTGYASCSVLTIIRKMREISQFQAPGSWADMDMLEIGNNAMNEREEQTHMAFWSALKSPLIIGADLTNISDSSLAILKNKELIAINQDSLGVAVNYVPELSIEGELQVWVGPLSSNRLVALVLNYSPSNQTTTMTLPLSKLGGYIKPFGKSGNGTAGSPTTKQAYSTVRSVWDNKNLTFGNSLNLTIATHETKVLVLS